MNPWASKKLLIVGNPGEVHVGRHLGQAARRLGIDLHFADVRRAYLGNPFRRRIDWWLRGRRPARLREFSDETTETCKRLRPDYLITTGIAPLSARALAECRRLSGVCINYLTDDPWNPAHYAPWFMAALKHYDCVFSPREANIAQLREMGPGKIEYLPFAYSEDTHFPEAPASNDEMRQLDCDVLFVGGADEDRIPWVTTLLNRGKKVALYGGYWRLCKRTAPFARGDANPRTLRVATGLAKVVLCLVRKANRDGHAMRSFETPAMKGCMVVERTSEHLRIFGEEGEAVLYFDRPQELLEKVDWLLARPSERSRLAAAAHLRITSGGHSYRDRLATMLLNSSKLTAA